ncbi:MAG: hypothetical protein BWX64_02841 [Acidobacteria bacterium ADurb.Bin051]|nr:MAG: hypothetical protein BWX64_02841 [Acidobacteria bacterium ADurb.Bin051]
MRGGERRGGDHRRRDLRLPLEDVEHRDDPVARGEERGAVDDRPAGAVDDERPRGERGERGRADEVPGRVGAAPRERHVEGEQLRTGQQLGERQEIPRPLRPGPRRVAPEDLAAEGAGERLHPAADMADPDDPDPAAGERPPLAPRHRRDGRRPPERHRSGVGSRRGRPGDPLRVEPGGVEVVGAARHGADEPHRGAREQRRVHSHRGPHPERIGRREGGAVDLPAGERIHLAVRGEQRGGERDLGIDDETHGRPPPGP